LQSQIDHHVCQTCGGELWVPGELVMLPFPGAMAIGIASGQPVVVLHCLNCAAVKLFDAASVGIDVYNP
jgi:hypothetical protein